LGSEDHSVCSWVIRARSDEIITSSISYFLLVKYNIGTAHIEVFYILCHITRGLASGNPESASAGPHFFIDDGRASEPAVH
jgi:hypothetical protein